MSSEPIVQVKLGLLRGKLNETENGKTYYSFNGIPYAKPPVGNLRFKDPEPFLAWKGIRDAIEEGNCASQRNLLTQEYVGSEDCLFLNVHTPGLKTSDGSKFPVIFNIHGGGFVNGSGNAEEFGPDYIVEQNIIVVSCNYRLGVFGFLCTDPVNARGDMGLKDQNLALRWTKENIESFGGDSDNITIFGISAGSASVEYHLLSHESRGLFNKAILHSGSVLNPWARIRNGVETALILAKMFGYDSNNTDGLFEFINKIESEDLVTAASKMLIDDLPFNFCPVINEFKEYKGFLSEEPQKLLERGDFAKVPTINGYCEFEGMMMLSFFGGENHASDLDSGNYIKLIPSHLKKSMSDLDEKLRKIYNEKNNIKNNNDHIINFLSDLYFNGGINYSFHQRLINNPEENYFYHFTHDGDMNIIKSLMGRSEKGACHGDDLAFLFITKYAKNTPNSSDKIVRKNVIQLWSNFIRNGKPTPDTSNPIKDNWLPATKSQFNYLEINPEMKVHLNTEITPERNQLWKEIYGSN